MQYTCVFTFKNRWITQRSAHLHIVMLVCCATTLAGADDDHWCPPHLVNNLYLQTHADKCYQFIFEERKWYEANHHCVQQGGTLITIQSLDVQEFVARTLTNVTRIGSRLWIGASDDHHEQDWRWVTGKNVSSGYSNWQDGSPSCNVPSYMCREDCACLLLEKGYTWYDTFCSANDYKYGFICVYDMQNGTGAIPSKTARLKQQLDPVAVSGIRKGTTGRPPLGENDRRPSSLSFASGAGEVDRCPTSIARNLYLRTHESKCYQFNFEEVKWFDAKFRCEQQGGSLLTIERPDIQNFLEHTLTNVTWAGRRLWIGATDDHYEQDWKWVTGQNVSGGYTNWQEGSPSCYLPVYLCREDCACLLLEEGYVWYTTFCSTNDFEYGFICQYDMTLETTTVTSASSLTTKSSTMENSTQTTTNTATAKKNIPSLSVVTTTTPSVINVTVNVGVDGLEPHSGALTICLILSCAIVIVSSVVVGCKRKSIKRCKCRRNKQSKFHNDPGPSMQVLIAATPPETFPPEAEHPIMSVNGIEMADIHRSDPHEDCEYRSDLSTAPDSDNEEVLQFVHGMTERSQETSSFNSLSSKNSGPYYACNSDINQSDTDPPHIGVSSTNVPSDEKDSRDERLRIPVQETQTSNQPIDPADLNAAMFHTIFNNQLDQNY